MARNRQKAKARKARREATGQPAAVSAEAAAAANGEAGAPPTDEGTINAAASVEAADEMRRAAKLKSQPKQAKTANEPKQPGRLRSFLRSSWAELRRVQWPDRAQVTTLTSIVIGFVIIAGLYLGAIDWIANKAVDFIIF